MKIFEYASGHGLWGKPGKAISLLEQWVEEKRNRLNASSRYLKELPFVKIPALPSYSTVYRLMKKFQKQPLMHVPLHREFHYPSKNAWATTVGPRIPLECLRYYGESHGYRPAVGLVRWFCEMAAARESDFSNLKTRTSEASEVAAFAETCWLADLVEALGYPRPDLTALELRLAWKSWEIDKNSPLWVHYSTACKRNGIDNNTHLIEIDRDLWLLATDLPSLMHQFSANIRGQTTGKDMLQHIEKRIKGGQLQEEKDPQMDLGTDPISAITTRLDKDRKI